MRSLVLVDPYICHQLSAPSIPIHPNAIRQTDRSRQLTVFVIWGLDELWRLHIRSIMFFTHRLLLTLMCVAFTFPFVESADMNTRNWLYRNLTDTNEYVKYLRPVNDSYQSVDVEFRFDPFIHYLDYINQELQLTGTMEMTWYDFRLSWNPDDYDDLHYIELPLNEIWQPELILYERMSKHNDESFQTETDIVKVYNTGKINWITIASTRTFCPINVDKFPKDEHTCDITFTTWLHQDNEQKLHIFGNTDSCEFEHLTWRLQFTDLGGNDPLYRCDHYLKNQSYVRYIATLERLDTQFGMYTLVAPNILVSGLSVFTLCFKRGDSNGPAFGMMCLLALIVQLGTLYQVLPDTAFSKVCQSIATLTIVVAVETLISVINMGIEDVSDIFAELENLQNFILSCFRLKRQGYNKLDGDVSQTKDPGVKTSVPRTSGKLPSGNTQDLNLGDDTKSGVKNERNESINLESYQNAQNIPVTDEVKGEVHTKRGAEKEQTESNHDPGVKTVDVKNASTSTQYVEQYRGWFIVKILATVFFFFSILGLNVNMLRSVSN